MAVVHAALPHWSEEYAWPLMGGLVGATAAACCYVPQKKVKGWSWQSYWLTQAAFCWLLLPIVGAFLTVPDFWQVVQAAPREAMLRSFLLGAAYGIGKLAASAVESIARQPEAAGNIRGTAIILAALIEGFTFFALILAMLASDNAVKIEKAKSEAAATAAVEHNR